MSEIDDYDYPLPKHLIAQQPTVNRADARLMVVERKNGTIAHEHVRDLPLLLKAGDALVLNETRVVPARLVGRRKSTGGHWEGLFLTADGHGMWRLLCKARGKLFAGERIELASERGPDSLALELVSKGEGGVWLVRPIPRPGDPPRSDLELLELAGRVPLPHYIRSGEMVAADRERYQTVFARKPGAVAAPTAGLHFTADLLKQLEAVGVELVKVTLHVGLDTFRPISVTSLAEHPMHAEWGQIDQAAVARLTERRQAGGRVIAVGTTSVRVLETAASGGTLAPWEGETRLFIRPGHAFHAVDGMLTNFHLPRTTLLVLVRTFGGDALMRRAYEEAIQQEYRFYSYGDAMLIL
ncbi:MAG TPA: tRNA preQ1(34) S-adenosylmethionine ribosyltransferase-isomerase QueA [Pirellulales bacterium]|nr:tRNA preQ1(34) S-adenosylmethionine ribosyltransferase-isomerase QueA [Pirellulales bacterium]